jgi:hypothetical protein
MFCDRCGTELSGNPSFCPTCGKAFRLPPAPPQPGRVGGNLRTLGILWLVYSVLRFAGGWFAVAFLPHLLGWGLLEPLHIPLHIPLAGLVRFGGTLLLANAALGVIAGWGLLERQSWARVVAIVAAFLALLHMPFGTALGIYTLWVLLAADSGREYELISRTP